MKLRIQLQDGRVETLEMQGTWIILEGSHLNRIRDGNGFEHFFNDEGYYDGYGAAIPSTDTKTAHIILEALEEKRRIEEE